MDDLVTLQKFNTLLEAAGIVEILEKNNVHHIVEKIDLDADAEYAGNTLDSELIIKVKPEDLETAQKLLEDLTEIDAEKLDKDYYLFEFSDKELLEILEKPDEWGLNDYHWAQEILKQRGKEVNKSTIEEWSKKRLAFLAQPERVSDSYILKAYIFCILGGFIGLFMGRHVKAYRKLLPNGQKVFAFDEESRLKGKKVEYTGLVCAIIFVVAIIILAAYY